MKTTRRVIILAVGAISLTVVAAASAAAVTRAGAVAPAAQGMTTGIRPPGAGDASATGAARPAGSWGRAIAVPGLGALSKGGYARVDWVSCASAGNCAAGGHYRDGHGLQGFVAGERHGRWGRAIEVPGLGALNKGGGADVVSVSCASAGSCAAGGYYTDRHRNQQGFVADERHGRWGRAIEVPGLGALAAPNGAEVSSVSCGSAGNCAAGGYYYFPPNIVVPIIATERGGRWGTAVSLPNNNNPGDGEVNFISCASAGNCLAGGGIAGDNDYTVTGDAFVVQERAGRWGPVRLIRGLRKLEHYGDPSSTGSGSWISSVACPSAGNCAVGGAYVDRYQIQHAFVAAERHGVWGAAIQVPGLAALNKAGGAEVTSVSCGSAGNCAAGGYYAGGGYFGNGPGKPQGFVAVERHGVWGTAIPVPGLTALNKGRDAEVTSVSCGSAGSCAVGGYYADRSHHHHGFVAVERHGVWGTAIQVPGLAALNTGGSAEVGSLSCPSPGNCAAGGFYTGRSGQHQGFVTQAR